jgi:hypothetical protein
MAHDIEEGEDPFAQMKPLYKKIEGEIKPRIEKGDYLGGLAAAEKLIAEQKDPTVLGFLLDLHSSYLATIGDDASARRSMSKSRDFYRPQSRARDVDPVWKERAEKVRWEDPKKVIGKAAKKHSVIMLSEAHHVAEHRAYGSTLLPIFKELGFTHFAMEALSNPQPLTDPQKVAIAPSPTTVGGYYNMEPQMAELVRTALRLGFTLVPYEDTGSDDRELSQAKNLYEAVLKDAPDTKVVVWAGYGHVHKTPLSGNKMFAGHLWEMTGKEPFSLFQVYDSLDPYGQGGTFYKPLVLDAKDPIERPMVLWSDGELLPGSDPIDGYIVHPPFQQHGEDSLRPSWFAYSGREALTGEAAPGALVQAYHVKEGVDSAPADQTVAESDGRYELRLLPGDYVVRTRDAEGKVLSEEAKSFSP